jgi:hypothetical protein
MRPIAPALETACGSNEDSTWITARTRSGSSAAWAASSRIVRAMVARDSRATRTRLSISSYTRTAASHGTAAGERGDVAETRTACWWAARAEEGAAATAATSAAPIAAARTFGG